MGSNPTAPTIHFAVCLFLAWSMAKQGMDPVDAAILLSHTHGDQIKQHVTSLLGALGGQKAESRLIEMIEEDTASRISSSAFSALRGMNSRKLMPLIMVMLTSGDFAKIQTASGMMSGNLKSNDIPVVLEVLENITGNDRESVNIRNNIYRALAETGDPKICPVLYEAYKKATDANRRQEVLRALSRCVGKEQMPIIIEILNNEAASADTSSSHYVASLIRRAGEIGDWSVSESLMKFLDSSDEQMLQSAIYAFSRLKDPIVAEKLCKLNLKQDYTRREWERIMQNYPGVVCDAGSRSCTLVSEEEMGKILEERKKKMQAIMEQEQPGPADDE